MRLHSLSLEHFRNYPALSLDLSEGSRHLFLGENGSGKTNLLEAISMISLAKSCRDAEEESLPQWDSAFYRVKGTIVSDKDEESRTLELCSELKPRKRRACFVNDVQHPVSAFVGALPLVIFLPEDLGLFSGSPALRRRFLDQLLCQVHPQYLRELLTYQRVLKQRNTLLKKIAEREASQSDLLPWDLALSEHGSTVTRARLELIEALNMSLPAEMKRLGGGFTDVELVYREAGDEKTNGSEEKMLALLAERHARDLMLLSTTVGPHRDDWHLQLDGREIHTFASRGQERLAVLALLFLEVSYLELRRGERPVLLLDDVFSELDAAHQESLLSSFEDHQVLLTSAHMPPSTEGMQVWDVKAGKVTPAQKKQFARSA